MRVVMLRSNPIDPDVRLEKEATVLTEAGHDVILLGWQRFGDAPAQEGRHRYAIRRLKFRAPLGKKVVLYLPVWWLLAVFWLLKEDWDIVHAADLDTYIPALVVAKLKRKRLIYDIFDFYVDMVTLPPYVQNCVAAFDIFLIRFADAVIVVDPSRLKQIGKEGDSSINVIYNSPRDLPMPSMMDAPREHQAPFKIFYAGGLGGDRDFEAVIQAARAIGDVQVELAGYGCHAERIQGMSEQELHITFLGTIPYDEVIRKTLQSDLLFALYDPDIPNNRYASPNKLFEAMMCRKPILVSDGAAMADIVKEENCGLVVPYGDVDAVKRAILTLKADPLLCRHLGENGRRAYETEYNWEIMRERLLEIYRNLDSEQERTDVTDDSCHRE
ncbi:glycosyltransferase family 4 protein [Methanoculleus sp. Wushi-C6]|uniref:Glycosyltransferase family 4 protein n=1 Tax=Methanoculleus caldifontis TaxID=2651577 RepID=A0ABU3X276_9EURY|nr:glycosyltransferase family 4 protein [Methanoculleus sp. Wushi-C6]MDV2482141.1 glycosyltransferase family 4 protein [Methanoculleus sp. Wushi-C6]